MTRTDPMRRIVVRGREGGAADSSTPEHQSPVKAKGLTLKPGETDDLPSLLDRLRALFLNDSIVGLKCDRRKAEVTDLDFLSDGDSDLYAVTAADKIIDDTDWVTLNVGGVLFSTCKSTLIIRAPAQSLLPRMFANEGYGLAACRRDRDGNYLIDRSPKYFAPILNYLRTGQLILEGNVSAEGVLEEAKYFGLGDDVTQQLEGMVSEAKGVEDDHRPLTRRDVISAIISTDPKSELRFQGTNLAGADLSKLDLRKINFRYANMQGCNLKGANMSFCNMERADLTGAVADGAIFCGARMVCAVMEAVSMRGCTFDDPSGEIASLEGANMRKADLEDSSMANVNLRVAKLKYVNLKNCYLRSAVLAGADLEHCDLSGSDLCEANLRGANLDNAKLELMPTPLHMSQTVR